MKSLIFLLVISVVSLAAAAPVDLQAYPFSLVLYDQNNQYYGLHWNFTRETQSIYFAVNVSTTGWVGFGLSPNGQMPASDVVIGWVNGGQSYFHDRFAEARSLPPIDPSQDWFLLNSEEENGFTILEFSRNFTTCDDRDLDITTSTDRVVWSFSLTDPSDPSGSDAVRHDYAGSTSVNLIGGLPTRNAAPTNDPYLKVSVTNVTIPDASTTYWCAGFRLPSQLITTTHFVNRVTPVIVPHARSFVHHMLAYLCSSPIDENFINESTVCNRAHRTVSQCRGLEGLLISAWAIGGEEFIYPEGVAYPVGGLGKEEYLVLEMHYDNPQNNRGVIDSSGFRLHYTLEAPTHRAGILSIGHTVTPLMLVPPNTRNYTVAGFCSPDCTRRRLPQAGIRIFADLLHTHLVGRGLTLEQYRFNTECNVWEEVEPIDRNQNYDFNFQQTTYLPKEHLVLPGDALVLKCNYSTTMKSTVTFGGESTEEEMCLSFPVYYPKQIGFDMLASCSSFPTLSSFSPFITYLQSVNPSAAQQLRDNSNNLMRVFEVIDGLDWRGNPELALQLQSSLQTTSLRGNCVTESRDGTQESVTLPNVQCPYVAPPNLKCQSGAPNVTRCCDRVGIGGATPQAQISFAFAFLLLLLSIFI